MKIRLTGEYWGYSAGQNNVGDIVEAWDHPHPTYRWTWQYRDIDGVLYGISEHRGSGWAGELV